MRYVAVKTRVYIFVHFPNRCKMALEVQRTRNFDNSQHTFTKATNCSGRAVSVSRFSGSSKRWLGCRWPSGTWIGPAARTGETRQWRKVANRTADGENRRRRGRRSRNAQREPERRRTHEKEGRIAVNGH